ncbi:unnamed protein product [Linum trigynum]|uniref:Reverse transcriptase domain-containing protein n=1 Tax=Linum trigynum TaxID=586398 RepID=A0AAV2EAY7_9ROSI
MEFRPISLCNVLYKLVSKVLANRLKEVLDKVIGCAQSTFVPGRIITNNIMAAFECFHSMKRKKERRKGFAAAKIDMAKAYDRVEWRFLEGIMGKMEFETRWISLMMMCVKSVEYLVLVNRHLSEAFLPERGLRQGDPLSPYLFLLCAEGLSSYTDKEVAEGRIHGLQPARGAPVVSHMFFADDSIFFFRATTQESLQLKRILHDYEPESGQLVNFQKSEVSFSKNIKPHGRLLVGGVLGMKTVEMHDKYLGLATEAGRSKKELFVELKDRIWKKLKGWKEKTMSAAAREVMIKSVAQAQLTYVMSVFRIPEGIIEEINNLMLNFWWDQRGSERRAHWVKNEELVLPKEEGGLGFRDLRGFNTALLAKQLWRLHKRPTSLAARIMKAKYHKKESVLEAVCGHNPSFIWRSITSAQDFFHSGLRWRIGNGTEVRIWGDKWIPMEQGWFVPSPPWVCQWIPMLES